MSFGFARQLTLVLALLLLTFAGFVALLGRQMALDQEIEVQQRLSAGLASNIVAHWPEVTAAKRSDTATRRELLRMLMVVNPNIQVYLLDADGRVDAYIGEPGMVRINRVDLVQVRAFLGGATLPIRGTNPMGGSDRIFTAAMFPPSPTDRRPPGYVYIVLESATRAQFADAILARTLWHQTAWALGIALLTVGAIGAALFIGLTLPLNRLARRMQQFSLDAADPAREPAMIRPRTEIAAIDRSFRALATRITDQLRAREAQAVAHRDMMADVAHDLRTPLTALQGYLEALDTSTVQAGTVEAGSEPDPAYRRKVLGAALAQSNKVRRLSHQLFELATLQATDQPLQREVFRLDELVTDTVQKFEFVATPPPVVLSGRSPDPIEFEGDPHLIERALTNLIDNALRHGLGTEPVRVSVQVGQRRASVLIADGGCGLPPELARRLNAGQPVRDPPLRQPGGSTGGLGLAIAQRIALLHGGTLGTVAASSGGTRMMFTVPVGEIASMRADRRTPLGLQGYAS